MLKPSHAHFARMCATSGEASPSARVGYTTRSAAHGARVRTKPPRAKAAATAHATSLDLAAYGMVVYCIKGSMLLEAIEDGIRKVLG